MTESKSRKQLDDAGPVEGETPDPPYAQTLGRGIEMLKLLADGPRSSRDLGEQLSLNRSTSYRLAQTLVSHGLVQRSSDGATYALTTRLWELGVRAIGPSEIRLAAGRAVRELCEKYGETVHLSVYDQGEVVYIDKADAWQPIGSYTRLGSRAPAYCVATGKALLAYQPEREIERCLAMGLKRFTPHTLTDPDELRRALTRIRRDGHAINQGEWRQDVAGLAVPLFDAVGSPVAALGFSGPAARLLERSVELLETLRDTARELSGSPS